MNNIVQKIVLVLVLLSTISCGEQKKSGEKFITTTIAPIKYLVESITADDYKVNIIVPQGASPESYEMTARQLIDIADSEFVFSFNLLDFEKGLTHSLEENNLDGYLDLTSGIDLIEGSCSHADVDEAHSHGVDPHIWTSISNLKTISSSIHDAIIAKYPDSIKYTKNYNTLLNSLDVADSIIREKLSKHPTKYFLIYHPSLGYYAKEYGLTQIAFEKDGKEPNISELRSVIDTAKMLGLNVILYQKEFRQDVVVAGTQDINGKRCEINILGENIIDDLIEITDIISNE